MKVRVKNGMNGLKIAQTRIWGVPRRRLRPPGCSLWLGKYDFQTLPAVSYALGAVAYGWQILISESSNRSLRPLGRSLLLEAAGHALNLQFKATSMPDFPQP